MEAPLLTSSSKRPHVLHLDDDQEFLELTKSYLEREGTEFTVITESDPDDALNHLKTEEIDAIVCDYDMPHTNGLAFLERVREECPELPFILFTGKGSEEIASEAISRGVTDYIQKKLDTDQYTVLANRIQNAVGQYRAEQEIEERSEWYSRILEHSSDYVLIVNDMGNIRYVSPAIERMMGYAPEEIVGEDAFTFVLEDDKEEAAAALAQTISQPEREVTVEFRAEADDGAIQWLEVRGRNFLHDSLIQGVMVNVRDITERKQRETELKRRQAFLEHSSDIITVLDEDGTIDYVSPAVEQVLGYSRDELTGENAFEFIHPTHRDDVMNTFASLMDSPGEEEQAVFQFRKADDEWCWLEARGRNHLTDPIINGMVINARDVTERIRREREIERQNQRLEEFMSVVSHDLRNPLSVAEGRLQLAREECDSEHIAHVETALDRMDELIVDLLELSRQGQTIDVVEPVDLAESLEACWGNVETRQATLDVQCEATIEADESRFKQLFENVIRNAIEHGGEDVHVTLGSLPDGFYLEDDGPGIPEGERETVFQAGYTTNQEGTGFGLSIVKQIVEAHDWEITVREGSAGGASFAITGVQFVES